MNKDAAEKLIDAYGFAMDLLGEMKDSDCVGAKQLEDQRALCGSARQALLTALLGQDGEAKPDPIREAAIAHVRALKESFTKTTKKDRDARHQTQVALIDAVDSQGNQTAINPISDPVAYVITIGNGDILISTARQKNIEGSFDSIGFRKSSKHYPPGTSITQEDGKNGIGDSLVIRFLNLPAVDSVLSVLQEIRGNIETVDSQGKEGGKT